MKFFIVQVYSEEDFSPINLELDLVIVNFLQFVLLTEPTTD